EAAALRHVPVDGRAQARPPVRAGDHPGQPAPRDGGRPAAQRGAVPMTALADLVDETSTPYEGGFLDEYSKREVRRAVLSAVAVPGYQVPFGSREMPVARGWGSGGLQITLAIVGD